MGVFAWLTGSRANNDQFLGQVPSPMYGEAVPDGDASPFAKAPVGTLYVRKVDDTHIQYWVKGTDNNLDSDWRVTEGLITEYVTLADLEDGLGTAGSYPMTADLPAGAFVERVSFNVLTAFIGDTSAALDVGTGSDTDAYVAASGPNGFTAGWKDGGAPSGTQFLTGAVTDLTFTVTGAADFTSISAGAAMVHLRYRV